MKRSLGVLVFVFAIPAMAAWGACTPTEDIARLAGDASATEDASTNGQTDSDASADADTRAALSYGGGVNLAGAEFAPTKLPGNYGTDYVYPTHAEVDYYRSKGARVLRFPILWERFQRTLGADLDSDELARADDFIGYATSAANAENVVLDLHSYGAYAGAVVGVDPSVPASTYADIWTKLATHYASNPRVLFGLTNSEKSATPAQWLPVANAAIAAIRAAGATNVILVAGGGPPDASLWDDDDAGDNGATSNANVMTGVVDPGDNFVIQLTQYLDPSGLLMDDTCVSSTIGSERLATATTWLRNNHRRGFVAELGAGTSDTCLAALADLVRFIDDNADVLAGWTYWAGGPMWGGYTVSIEPIDGGDRPQLGAFGGHF